MSIAIYGRVSTQKQTDEGFGLDVQLQELVKEATEKGVEYSEYIDSGISGTSLDKREGLQSLLEDIKKGEITEVWVTKLSRLGRNSRDVLNIIHEFDKYDVNFRSVRDGIDTSNHMGKIMVQFMSIIAEMERDVIIETTRAGAEYRAQLGKIYGAPKVLGYDREGHGKDSKLVINEEEAVIVRKIFKLYNDDMGYKAIITRINDEGHRTVNDNLFSLATVKGILTNPLYVGKIRYNLHKDWNKKRRRGKQSDDELILVDGQHDAIISKNLWNKTEKKMAKNTTKKPPVSGRFLINGILKCPQCGTGMIGTGRTSYRKSGPVKVNYYTCGANHNKGRQACSANSMRAEIAEELVLRQVSEYLQKDELPQMLYEYIAFNTVDINKLPKKLSALKMDLKNVEKKIERNQEMYIEGMMSKKDMTTRLTKLNSSKLAIEAEVQSIKIQLELEDIPEIEITVEDIKVILKSIYETLTTSSDRLLLKKFLQSIIESVKVIDRSTANMQVNLMFTQELLKLFNKEVPKGIEFKYEDSVD